MTGTWWKLCDGRKKYNPQYTTSRKSNELQRLILQVVLARKPEENRKLGRTSCRLEDNIKMDFREVGSRWWVISRIYSFI